MTSPDRPGAAPDDTAPVVRLLVVGVLFALAVTPSVLLVGVLGTGAAAAALAVIGLVFVGPAVAAALWALGDKAAEDGFGPVAAFGRGYRLNVVDALKLWVPSLVVLAVLAFSIVDATGQAPAWVVGFGIGAAVLLVLWLVQATVVASFFTFRARDTAKLGLYFLGRLPRSTLVVLVAVVLAAGVGWLMSPALLALLGVLWVALVLRADRPLLAETQQRFVRGDSA